MNDRYWMEQALMLAQKAYEQNEVPVGAILVHNHQKIAEAWNQPITLSDPTAHAEVIALRQAGKHLQNYRLLNTTLYVTLEPCLMCAGAIAHARIGRLVYGALDNKAGAISSVYHSFSAPHAFHKIDILGGVLSEDCQTILKDFFKQRR